MTTAQINTITVNGVEYVEKGATPDQELLSSNVQIVILQRGWVMVGLFSQNGDQCSLDNAHVIREWGTTKGLGELAASGPTSKTKLDPAGHVEFHQLTMIARIASKKSLWKAL